LIVPFPEHKGAAIVMPGDWFVEYEPMLNVTASERVPVWARDELTVMFVTPPAPDEAPPHPSVVPDSNPQYMQLLPFVHASGLVAW
jgi:hypothetical protein